MTIEICLLMKYIVDFDEEDIDDDEDEMVCE